MLPAGAASPRRREALGWSAPALALVAAGVLLLLGNAPGVRRSPPWRSPQAVDADPGREESSVGGLLAVYRTEGGPAAMETGRGGLLEIDQAGVAEQARRLLLDDVDASWRSNG